MIKIKNLSYTFKNGRELFSDINFSINDGEILMIKGLSGRGKSTLLDILAGLKDNNKGDIYFNNHLFSNFSKGAKASFRMNNIAYLRQGIFFFNHLNIFENILFQKKFQVKQSHKDLEQAKEKILTLFKVYKLNIALTDSPEHLSGGEKVRLAVIRAIINEANYIFLDESLSQLDDCHQEIVLNSLKEKLKDKIKNILIVSHQEIDHQKCFDLSKVTSILN